MQYPPVQYNGTLIDTDTLIREIQQLETLRYDPVTFPKYSTIFSLRDVVEDQFSIKIDSINKALIYRLILILPLLDVNQGLNTTHTVFENLLSLLTLSRSKILKKASDRTTLIDSKYILTQLNSIMKTLDTNPEYVRYLQPMVDSIQFHLKALDVSDISFLAHGIDKLSNEDVAEIIMELIAIYYREDLVDEIVHSHEKNVIINPEVIVEIPESVSDVSSLFPTQTTIRQRGFFEFLGL